MSLRNFTALLDARCFSRNAENFPNANAQWQSGGHVAEFDADCDGRLSSTERTLVGRLRFAEADSNKDGFLLSCKLAALGAT